LDSILDTLLSDRDNALFFQSAFAAVQALGSVLCAPAALSPLQPPFMLQALLQSGCQMRFLDVDYYGSIAGNDTDAKLFKTDYAGIMPAVSGNIELWINGAGYLDREPESDHILIDLQTLDAQSETPGCVIISRDGRLLEELRRFATLGIEKRQVWNDAIRTKGVDGLMSPLAKKYWEERVRTVRGAAGRLKEISGIYAEMLSAFKLIDMMPTASPRFFPVRLAPELLCPKEDIYTELHQMGVDATVPFKPLYRYDICKAETLRGSEAFYKAVLALPTHGLRLDEAEDVAQKFLQVIEKYAYRGCSF
jgi:hypothetical protein